jgi:hypothetical protein
MPSSARRIIRLAFNAKNIGKVLEHYPDGGLPSDRPAAFSRGTIMTVHLVKNDEEYREALRTVSTLAEPYETRIMPVIVSDKAA